MAQHPRPRPPKVWVTPPPSGSDPQPSPSPRPGNRTESTTNRRQNRPDPRSRRPVSRPQPAAKSVLPEGQAPRPKIKDHQPVVARTNPQDFSSHQDGPQVIYKVIFFDTFAQTNTEQSLGQLKLLLTQCDQLNVVIKAEGNMDDPELLSISAKIKVF